MKPTAAELDVMTQWDTPTICNALELIAPHRRGYGYTAKAFSCLYPDAKPIVGFARTGRIRAAAPDLTANKGMADRFPYYEYVASGDNPTIVVIEDLDAQPGYGAFWGEVNTALHKGLGALGVVTNGSYRDIGDCAPGFQILGGQVGPSHAFVHTVDFNCPVSVHGMQVEHDDVIHADRHGAVVIPTELIGQVPDAVAEMNRRESGILAAARANDFSIEKLKALIVGDQDIH